VVDSDTERSHQNGKQSDNPAHVRVTRTKHCRWSWQNLTYPLSIMWNRASLYLSHGNMS